MNDKDLDKLIDELVNSYKQEAVRRAHIQFILSDMKKMNIPIDRLDRVEYLLKNFGIEIFTD